MSNAPIRRFDPQARDHPEADAGRNGLDRHVGPAAPARRRQREARPLDALQDDRTARLTRAVPRLRSLRNLAEMLAAKPEAASRLPTL